MCFDHIECDSADLQDPAVIWITEGSESYLGLLFHSQSLWSVDDGPYFPGLLGRLSELKMYEFLAISCP